MAYKEPRNGEVAPIVSEEIGVGNSKQTTVKHPAFGQVNVSRRSAGGGGVNLYDSDFGHNNFVTITLQESELHRDLSRDWHFPRGQIVEFTLSESQWATFVSSFNMGSGTPCTINWREGHGSIPGIPAFDRSEVFKKDMKETTKEAEDGIKRSIAAIKEAGLSKKKQEELLSGLNKALQTLQSSIPFVQDQFDEHVEVTVERGMQEIHGYMNSVINRVGQAAIAENGASNYISIDKPLV